MSCSAAAYQRKRKKKLIGSYFAFQLSGGGVFATSCPVFRHLVPFKHSVLKQLWFRKYRRFSQSKRACTFG
jgi:hypothetical protein